MQERRFSVKNLAKEKLIPDVGVLRVTHLYIGQGDSTLLTIPNGNSFIYVLVDCHIDQKNGGIDLIKLLKDLLDEGEELIFINTHPHNDHLCGLKNIYEQLGLKEVWHAGHKPGKKHKDSYEELTYVLDKLGKEKEFVLFGSNSDNTIRKSDKETSIIKKLGDIDFQVLSPAEYVSSDIEGEDEEARYRRIHEMSGVIKFKYGTDIKSVLHTGDSDKKAWKEHITEYHKNSLSAEVLSASHHGSRTFFKNGEDDEDIYEEHIENISPDYLIISAPMQDESPHDHPHDDALDIYKKHVDEKNIYHLGEERVCVFVDIDIDGNLNIEIDKDLVSEYGFEQAESENGESKNKKLEAAKSLAAIAVSPKPYLGE